MKWCRRRKSEVVSLCGGMGRITQRQGGIALIASLIFLVMISMLGISAAHIAIEENKVSRSDADWLIAFQAAEAALADAELDIDAPPNLPKYRSQIFSKNSALGFPEEEGACNAGAGNIYLGLCSRIANNGKQGWLIAHLTDDSMTSSNGVTYGTFTGNVLPISQGTLPVKLPRYLIELMVYNAPGESADQVSYFYRITALGYGTRESTKVVLQTLYRKDS